MTTEVLSNRTLNRTLLQRQLLLERADRSVLDTVGHLVGMQAQVPLDPYLALWSRLDGFQTDDLAKLLIDRAVVRIVVMRGTVHLVTADDCLILRPLAQPVLEGELKRHRDYAPLLEGVDLAPVIAYARDLLGREPLSTKALRDALTAEFPDLSAPALVLACRNRLALVQVPPRGVWGRSLQVTYATAQSWLGRPTQANPPLENVIVRYLAAFGPATTADISTWSRLTGLREVIEPMRSRLRTFRDERGRELWDVPDGPLADPDQPAPVRFLPEYDNLMLSHADRSRVLGTEDAGGLYGPDPGPGIGTVLVDGRLAATWTLKREKRSGPATMTVNVLPALSSSAREQVAAEGQRWLDFSVPDAPERALTFVTVD